MGSSFRLGRIAGIEFGVNWSWFVVFVLIVWTLASGIFPSTNPDLSKATHIAMAIVAAFLFFLSILLHEFGHALEARREGIEIDGITLWLFGGVARFKDAWKTAGAEFRVAIAGPIVSLDTVAKTFVVREVTVSYAGEVDFRDGTAADLAVGRKVEVRGKLSTDGTRLQAERIEFDD